MPTKEEVIEAAKQCFDPEIPVNIWDLGLIYNIDAGPDKVAVKMTVTAQGCPAAQSLPADLKSKIQTLLKVKDVTVDLVFDPLWTPERISEEGKKKLGIENE